MTDDPLIPKAEMEIRVDRSALPEPIVEAFAQPAPPVVAQRTSHPNSAKMASEKVVIAAPLSYAGSAARIWKLVGLSAQPAARVALAIAALCLITFAWTFVTCWYLLFGLFLVPYRLIRRGSRKRKREALQHREMLAAVQDRRP
jgi:carbon starvation protein CstA